MFVLHRNTPIAATILVILLSAAALIAKATFTPISATAWMTAPPAGGEVTCIGGTPTGTWPPCSPGSKAQVRGMVLTYRQVATKANGSIDPLLTGTRTIVFNHEGTIQRSHQWGTWRLVLDASGGEWEGTFTGFGDEDGTPYGQIVGRGTQGEVDGLELRADYRYETFPGLETVAGYVIDPKGRK